MDSHGLLVNLKEYLCINDTGRKQSIFIYNLLAFRTKLFRLINETCTKYVLPYVSSASRFQEKSFLSADPYLLVLGPAVDSGMWFQNFSYAIMVQIF